jgi:hypothetical protein
LEATIEREFVIEAPKNSKRRKPFRLAAFWKGAATGTRTLDLRFTKASLYQLSYGGKK